MIESNGAAARVLCLARARWTAKVNPNGGAIALGHRSVQPAPPGDQALYELQRVPGRYGLMTMCIGGGQGIAGVIESML